MFDRSGLGRADPIILLLPDGSERADAAASLAAAAAADPECLLAKIETFQAFASPWFTTGDVHDCEHLLFHMTHICG